MSDHRVDDLVPRGAWLEHRRGHIAQGAEQAVGVLEVGDEPLRGERAADELRPRPQHLVGRWGAPHGGQGVAAHEEEVAVRLVRLAEGVGGDGVEVGLRGGVANGLAERRLPRDHRVGAVHPRRRGDAKVRGHELEMGALVPELIDRRAVEIARHQEVGEGDGEQTAQLLGVGAGVAHRRRQQRGQPGKAVERRALGVLQRALDEGGSRGRAALELAQAAVVRRLLPVPVVEVDQAQQPVAGLQREAERGLDLVAADERGVDLRGGVTGDQALARDGQPDGRPVLVHGQLVRHLALLLVR